MNAQSFLENFGHLANAPDGVKLLRKLVIQLGIKGQLNTQDSNDEPTVALINKVISGLPEEKFENPFLKQIEASITSESVYELPLGWSWLPLGHIGIWATGCGFPKQYQGETGNEFLFCKVSDMNLPGNEVEIRTTVNSIDAEVIEKIRARANPKGTVIFPKIGGAIATHKRRLVTKPTIIDNNCSGIQPIGLTDERWLLYFMQSLDLTKFQSGTSVPSVSQSSLDPIRIGLPPLDEQNRIATKVDELIALCDKLEAQQQERERRFPVLSRATHTRFAESPTPENLTAVFDEAGSLSSTDLRNSILSLAFKGRLLPQDLNDDPATTVLGEIGGSLKKSATKGRKASISESERPYELPEKWCWSKFPELGEFGRGKSKHRPRNDPSLYIGGIHPLVQTGDVSRAKGKIHTFTGQYNEKGLAQSKLWPEGTLCITIAANIADTGILGFDACFPDSVVGFIPSEKLPSVRYFEYFMRTAKERLEEFAPATAQKNINLGILEQVLIPIAPVAEQRRIVDKVDQLMALVDQLEEQQTKKSEVAAAYAQAAVAAITGTQTREPEAMKAPKTELITKLEIGEKPKPTDSAPLSSLIAKSEVGLSAKALWQQSGLEIDAFYQQLKTEMARRWIVEPVPAVMQEVKAN